MEGKHPGLGQYPSIPACLGDSVVEERPGGCGLARAWLLSVSRNLTLDEAAATFGESPKCCQHGGRRLCRDPLLRQ